MKKKLFILLLALLSALICAFALSACGKVENKDEPPLSVVVTFNANGGHFDDGAASKTATADGGGRVTFSEQPVCDGKEFKGWSQSDDNDLNKIINLANKTFTSNVTVYAVWQNSQPAADIVITFNANGGHFGGGALTKTATTNQDGKVAFTEEPVYDGKEFKGWSKSGDNNISGIIVLADEVFTTATTVYAVWADAPAYTKGLKFTAIEESGAIKGYSVAKGDATEADIIIPEEYLGKPVTELAENAFYGSEIQSIELPESITAFGDYAFYYCEQLTSIQIPANVKTIGTGAFYKCYALESVTFDSQSELTDLGLYVFCECSALQTIVIPADVTVIPKQTFQDCYNLESVTFEDGSLLSEIGRYAFYSCNSLETVHIPQNVGSIGENAFGSCYALSKVYITDIEAWLGIDFGDLYDSNPMHYAGEIYVDGDLLTQVNIRQGITEIKNLAFYNWNHLESITIPDSVVSVGKHAFKQCRAEIIWSGTPAITEIAQEAFSYYKGAEITIPQSVETIAKDAFYGCTELTSLVIPAGVTSIHNDAFRFCPSLIELTNLSSASIPSLSRAGVKHYSKQLEPSKLQVSGDFIFYEDGATVYLVKYTGDEAAPRLPNKFNGKNYEIYQSAFRENQSITTINIPDCVTKIGESAFESCLNLTCLTIPASIGRDGIADRAFDLDYRLVEVHNLSSSLNLQKGKLDNGRVAQYAINIYNTAAATNKIKTTPDGEFTYYEDDSEVYLIGYNGNKTAVQLPTELNGKKYRIFRAFCNFDNNYNLDKIKSVTVPDGVTAIDEWSFYDCDSLQKVNIPASVKMIGEKAFSGCNSLKNIIIPQGVLTIGDYAFESCDSITSIVIPYGVTSIGDDAFFGCDSLANVTFSNSVTTIGRSAFYNCDFITSISIPDSVTTIGDSAFSGCDSLESVTIGSGLSKISSDAFSSCKKLSSFEISDRNENLCMIDEIVYNYAKTSIVMVLPYIGGEVRIADGVTTIAKNLFSGCSEITSVIIPDSVTTIGEYAFYNCEKLLSVEFGENLVRIDPDAFTACRKLESATFKNKTGWKVSFENDIAQGEDMNVNNASTNAQNLRDDNNYSWYYWLREV